MKVATPETISDMEMRNGRSLPEIERPADHQSRRDDGDDAGKHMLARGKQAAAEVGPVVEAVDQPGRISFAIPIGHALPLARSGRSITAASRGESRAAVRQLNDPRWDLTPGR